MRRWGIRKFQWFAQCDVQRRGDLELELTFSHQWPTSLCLISSVPAQFSVSSWFSFISIYSGVPHPIPSFCFPALTFNATGKVPSCVLIYPMSSLNRSAPVSRACLRYLLLGPRTYTLSDRHSLFMFPDSSTIWDLFQMQSCVWGVWADTCCVGEVSWALTTMFDLLVVFEVRENRS